MCVKYCLMFKKEVFPFQFYSLKHISKNNTAINNLKLAYSNTFCGFQCIKT